MSRSTRITLIALSSLLLVTAAVLELSGDEGIALAGYRLPELCTWRRWFDRECPTCGLTRACVAIVHGQWSRAWRFHPAGFVVIGLAIVLPTYQAWRLWRDCGQSPFANKR